MSRNALPGAFSFQSLSGYWWIALPGVVGFVVAMLIAWTRWPEPHMHDDFGNLLIASTLLEGRLTNPTPQAWESLETFHVVMQPTYASKYPIGLGAFLAIGKLILGSFAGGLWMCAGLASAAVAWMIAGVFPKRWACFSGLFTATHPYWQNGWSQEFTNGWLAVVGISCVVGGFFRLHRFARFHHFVRKTHQVPKVRGAILGIGIGAVLVLVSRPFEGGVACLFLGCLFLSMLIQRGALRYFWFWKAAVPGISVLFAGIAFQLAINIAITGDWRKLPYQLHETQYGVAPVLIWQTPKEPSIGHRFPEQARFHYGWSMDAYNRTASWKGYMDMMQTRLWTLRNHWGIFVIAASCLALFLAKPRRLVWGLMAVACVALGIVNGIPWSVPQYVSPLIPIFLFLSCLGVQQGIREFQRSLGGRSFRTFPWAWILGVALVSLNGLQTIMIAKDRMSKSPGWEETWAERRSEMINRLSKDEKLDLVLVSYPSDHDIVNQEWVFNEANINSTQVLWARSDGGSLDQKLLAAYPQRKAWRLGFFPSGEESLQELTD